MSDFERLTDTELVTAFRAGDQAAFAGIYDRYADRIYSYCLTMLRNPEDAADASHDTFVKAATRLEQLQDPEKLRPWLFAVARNEARGEGRHRARVTLDPDLSESLVDDPDLAMGAKQDELRALVWDAVDGLGERDQELMALHLTEGLEGEDLAEAMGVEMSHLHVLVSRMRGRVEKALGALLIARLGSPNCHELDGVLEDWDGRFTTDVRARVNRHIGGCETCQDRRALLIAPANVLPGIMVVAAPASLRTRVLDTVVPVPDPVQPTPPPAPVERHERRELGDVAKLAIFAVVTVVVGLVGIAVSAQFEPLDVGSAVAAPAPEVGSTTTTTTLATSTSAVAGPSTTSAAPSSGPAVIEVSTAMMDFGDDQTVGQFDISNAGGEAAQFTVASSIDAIALSAGGGDLAPGATVTYDISLDRDEIVEGDIAEIITVSWSGGSISISVVGTNQANPILHNPQASPADVQLGGDPGCTRTLSTISVRVRDNSPLSSVIARWSADGGANTETAMSLVGGETYEGEVGPFTVVQAATVRIVATDEFGNAGGASVTVNVVACP